MRRRFLNNGCSPINIDDFFTIYALHDNLQVSLNNNLEYCIDGDGKWIFLSSGKLTKPINAGQTVSFKGDCIIGNMGIGNFTITQPCNLQGNILSIVKSLDVNTNVPSRMFYHLFRNTPIIDAHKLVVPFLKLDIECYSHMFYGCTSLTTAPSILPATTLTLADFCYQNMFSGCTSLTTAPELPATTLTYGCYSSMFSGCTSLTTAPELPATTLAHDCYYYMFNGCTKLKYIKMLATDISASNCLYYWTSGVASTGTFVKNPDMNSLPTGISGIPSGWTVVNDGEESGGSNLTFPITLVEGDNGEIGKLVFEYCKENPDKELPNGGIILTAEDGNTVYTLNLIKSAYMTYSDIVTFTGTYNGIYWFINLDSDGILTAYQD